MACCPTCSIPNHRVPKRNLNFECMEISCLHVVSFVHIHAECYITKCKVVAVAHDGIELLRKEVVRS